MPEFVLRLFGIEVARLDITPDPEVEEEEEEEPHDYKVTTSDVSFGFAPDPLFFQFEWEDDEE
jgi:hypothetical protein